MIWIMWRVKWNFWKLKPILQFWNGSENIWWFFDPLISKKTLFLMIFFQNPKLLKVEALNPIHIQGVIYTYVKIFSQYLICQGILSRCLIYHYGHGLMSSLHPHYYLVMSSLQENHLICCWYSHVDVAHKNVVMTCFMFMLKWYLKLSIINDGLNLSNY